MSENGPPPYFSVVTPSYEQGEWIAGCIQSVLAQGVTDFEHIIFDNCSKDGTARIAARYPHLIWRSEPDRGQAHALNRAMALARGEVICWLNADDRYPVGTFETVRQAFSNPATEIIYGDAEEVFFDGRPAGVRRARFECRDDLLYWWERRVDLLQPAVFFRRRLIESAGPLREDFYIMMDTEFWWRLSEKHEFHYIPKPLAIQMRQPQSKTVKSTVRMFEEKERFFQPLLDERFPDKRMANYLRRRIGLGSRFLDHAQFTAPHDSEAARLWFSRAVLENPFLLLTPRWWVAYIYAFHLLPRRGRKSHAATANEA